MNIAGKNRRCNVSCILLRRDFVLSAAQTFRVKVGAEAVRICCGYEAQYLRFKKEKKKETFFLLSCFLKLAVSSVLGHMQYHT